MVGQLFGKVFSVKLSQLPFNPAHRKQNIHKREVFEDRSRLDKELLTQKLLETLSEADLARTLHQILSDLGRKHRKSKEEIAE